jgi:putative DNA methylase
VKKKLIEVALPLEAINRESAREKSIRHGHPSTLHLWWARRPLASTRAVLFASLVDDPSSDPERFPTEVEQAHERERLFALLDRLSAWEATTDEALLAEARAEIRRSNPDVTVLDPFCGGGAIPLEAQRLGLRAVGADLNPVAVLVTKALLEIPYRFLDGAPVHRGAERPAASSWAGTAGLVEDIEHYAEVARTRAEKEVGRFYPSVDTAAGAATPIAWLWARTVRCPNPACRADAPLVRSWTISRGRRGGTRVEPSWSAGDRRIGYRVLSGTSDGAAADRPGTMGRGGGRCLVCDTTMPLTYIREEGAAGRLGSDLLAIVAGGLGGRRYLDPTPEQIDAASVDAPVDTVGGELSRHPQYMGTPRYGLTTFSELFTPRQLLAITAFSDAARAVRADVERDALAVGFSDDPRRLEEGGSGAAAYADAVIVYLALGVDRLADYSSAVCSWHAGRDTIRNTFARQAIPMVWDYAEANPFSDSTGNWRGAIAWVTKALQSVSRTAPPGRAIQRDAAAAVAASEVVLVSTDPPYYDNVPYADLSDFFYVWLRRTIGDVLPDLFSTLLTPKTQELVADTVRFGGRDAAKVHFESGMREVFTAMRDKQHPDLPLTIFYAFKQAETATPTGERASTGWETMLEGLIGAGFAIDGTWPVRSELANRMRSFDSNTLASSIVLVCRPRTRDASLATRKDFLSGLRSELAPAVRALQYGNIAPVDLAQAALGPGMAIFSRYARVIEADGSAMTVRTALGVINATLDELLSEQEGDFDADTRWAVTWFEQYGLNPGPYGTAETLSKAKNTAVNGLVDAGMVASSQGRVRLLDRSEMASEWNPRTDHRLTVWAVVQHMIRLLEEQGEDAAATVLAQVGGLGDAAKELAYRLYSACEHRGWTHEAVSYNALVVVWPDLARLAHRPASAIQGALDVSALRPVDPSD